MIGDSRVNHDALRESILAVARSKRRKDPVFIDIADAYRHETSRILAEIERQRSTSTAMRERIEIEEEDVRLRDIVEGWSADRLIAAKDHVQDTVSSFRGKSSDPSSWSRVFIGLLVAADAMLGEGES